jgi:uncharacterized protein YjiS (DUF1127 family)
MSHTEPTPPNSSVNDAGTTHPGMKNLDPAGKSRFRPDVTEAEKRHPSIESQVCDAQISHLDPRPQMTGTSDNTDLHEHELDLDPFSRTLIMVPPRPTQAAYPKACRDLDIPSFVELTSASPALDADAPGAGNELVQFFGDLDSEPARTRSWVGWFLGMLASACSFCRREREISRSIAALSELDDRTLRDIGIHHRLQIPDIVRNGGRGA